MIISETERFIFVHNPKCAGTSVREALRNYDTTGDFFWMFDEWNGRTIDKAHLPLYILRQKYPEYFRRFNEYFVFMFVRNPYERFISAFNESNVALYDLAIQTGDYTEYMSHLNRFVGGLYFNLKFLLDRQIQRFVRQTDLSFLEKKNCIDLTLKVEEWPNNLKKIDFFHSKVQLALRSSEHLHRRPMGLTYRDLLDRNSIGKINDIYEDDFVQFDYAME